MIPALTLSDFRAWVAEAEDDDLQAFLDEGGEDVVVELEADDFFGTEGINKRFA